MKVLLAGVLGALVSGSVWLIAEHFLQANFLWMVILVGIVTGVCVHWAAGQKTAGATVRGALAVALTLLVIVEGRHAYAQILKVITKPEATADALLDDVESEDEEAADLGQAEQVVEEEVRMERDPVAFGSPPYLSPSVQTGLSPWDAVWMSVAALAAYITGKGGETSTAAKDEEPTDTPAAEPEAENLE